MSLSPKISVIVPVYNVEDYLPRCIDSILAQDYEDFELLLIDDGSTDKGGHICDGYAKHDVRVRVFHKENGGVSSARNLGLDNAVGEFVAFVDSDDYVESAYLSDLVSDMTREFGTDLVIQKTYMADSLDASAEQSYDMYSIEDFPQLMRDVRLYLYTGVYAKLFRTGIIKAGNIKFPEGMCFGEDGIFYFAYLDSIRKVVVSSAGNYHYEQRPGSAIHRKFGFKSEYAGFRQFWPVSRYMDFVKKYAVHQDVADEYCYNVSTYLHRAVTEIEAAYQLKGIPEKDWEFFRRYFRPISVKTSFDRLMINNFHGRPTILVPYLRFCRYVKDFLARRNLDKVMNLLKK